MIETEDTPVYGKKNKKKKLNVGSTWWPWNYSTWGLARQTDCHGWFVLPNGALVGPI